MVVVTVERVHPALYSTCSDLERRALTRPVSLSGAKSHSKATLTKMKAIKRRFVGLPENLLGYNITAYLFIYTLSGSPDGYSKTSGVKIFAQVCAQSQKETAKTAQNKSE
jgi:hypothetical protein